MSATLTVPRIAIAPWQGWVRAGSGFPSQPKASPGKFESGAAVFSLPEPREARTTSWARDGGRFCIFTGHLYNPEELAEERDWEAEYASGSAPPARVILAAYRKWGADLLPRLDGVFGLAIWDQPSETLICARDAAGIHPFYYSVAGEELVFSWDFEAVLGHPGVSRELHRVGLAEYLVHHWWNIHETHFRDVRRLPGSHGLRFTRGRLELFRYWNPTPSDGSMRWASQDELAQFPTLLKQAVARAMRAAGGRGAIFLSGGLDSVSVAAYAAEIAAEQGWPPPRALSVIFPGASYEEPIQRAVALQLGFPQEWNHINSYLEGTPRLLHEALSLAPVYPGPPSFTFAPAFFDLLKLARQSGCDFVMNGDGGDELLGVTPIYAADLVRNGNWSGLQILLRSLMRYWRGPKRPRWEALKAVFWTYGIRSLLREWAWEHLPGLAMWRRRQLITEAFPAWLAPDPSLRREIIARFEEHWDRQVSHGNFYLTSMEGRPLEVLPHMTLEEHFYRSAVAGVSLLPPYWSRPLADLLLRVSPEALGEGGRWKGLARNLMEKRFPQLGFGQQKKVVATDFPKAVLLREAPALWQHLGKADAMAELGLVDPTLYHPMLAEHLASNDIRKMYRNWHGAGAETWIRHRIRRDAR